MPEREVEAHLIGRRYDCGECGEEMVRKDNYALASAPMRYAHICPNGHIENLPRIYPAYDVVITDGPRTRDGQRP